MQTLSANHGMGHCLTTGRQSKPLSSSHWSVRGWVIGMVITLYSLGWLTRIGATCIARRGRNVSLGGMLYGGGESATNGLLDKCKEANLPLDDLLHALSYRNAPTQTRATAGS